MDGWCGRFALGLQGTKDHPHPLQAQMDGANIQATKPFLLALLNLVKRNLNMDNTGMRKFSKENVLSAMRTFFNRNNLITIIMVYLVLQKFAKKKRKIKLQ